MEPIAAIDIGTNSTRLLIGRLSSDNKIEPLVTELRTTRLGDGVDASNYLKRKAIDRTIDALQEYKRLIDEWKVTKIRVVATSALRGVSNQEEFIEKVKLKTDLEVEVISGVEEANLSYLGVIKGLSHLLADNNLVIDIGGGSTEFITGSANEVENRFSIDVGAVRMTEKTSQIKKRANLISNSLASKLKRIQNKEILTLFGVGGTITTLAAIDQELEPYSQDKVHGYSLDFSAIKRIFLDLNEKSIDERKKVIGLQPSRADIIVAGVQILLKIMEKLKVDNIIVSESDILDGIIYQYCK